MTEGIHLSAASAEEFRRGMEIMRQNMLPLYESRGLGWKQDSIERHFASKENFSIWNGRGWRGLVSLEWQDEAMFIHTFQLDPDFHGGPVGVKTLQALERLCLEHGVIEMRWSAFRDSAAARLYSKMGIDATAGEDHLLNFVHRPKA